MVKIAPLSISEQRQVLRTFKSIFLQLYPKPTLGKLATCLPISHTKLSIDGIFEYSVDAHVVVLERFKDYLNVYVASPSHTEALNILLQNRKTESAICMLVYLGNMGIKNRSVQLRLGPFGIPCPIVGKTLIQILGGENGP